MVVAGEPLERVQRAIDSLGADPATKEIIVAAPPSDAATMAPSLEAAGLDLMIIDNPGGRRGPGLNAAVEAASGDLVVRLDARSILPAGYVSACAAVLDCRPEVGLVGGVQRPVPGTLGVIATGIARALANPWALGGAAYRAGREGPADTVYLGVFRRRELQAMGAWRDLDANEDYELAARYRASGRVAWVMPGLVVAYEARTSYTQLWQQYHAFGRGKVRYWATTGTRPVGRQALAMAVAPIALVAGIATSLRSARRAAGCAAVGAAAAATLDHLGSSDRAGPGTRAAAVAAFVVIWAAWLSGILAAVVPERMP
jgi:succinoglycan biosynthesis protein ExoA